MKRTENLLKQEKKYKLIYFLCFCQKKSFEADCVCFECHIVLNDEQRKKISF